MAEQIITPEGLSAFLVAETTAGTAVVPTASDALPLRPGLTFPSQPTAFARIQSAIATRSVVQIMRDLRQAGQVTIPTWLQPSGAAGTPPMEAPLLEALFGTETVTASTSVAYTLHADKNPFTLWIQAGNLVVFATGLVVTGMTLRGRANGSPEADWAGSFMRLGWCGEDALDGALAGGETTVDVDDATQFSVGALVAIGTSTGHQVTAVDYTANTLTVSPAVSGAQSDGATVGHDMPTPTQVGSPIDTRPAVKLDGTAVAWLEWEVEVSEPVAFLDQEVPADPSTADYPTGYVAQAGREVRGRVKAAVRTSDANRLRAVDTDQSLAIDWTGVATAGSQLLVSLPQGRYAVPELSSGDPTVELDMTFEGKATSALEDEASATYT